ncbi:DNA polymerase IV [Sulfobacillus acidophilus]|uniref:DNA polymerase IV n=1 Tax=Sulfobacillus acidophilus TaxID=53633 RepID=A0ABS3AYE5_9FIRM|nr:DNA polymerase IV [Sulfobacillus acidophilus]
MDCFFAAIEMRDNPKLRNIPMAVGGSPESRGVIATANYEARKYGVHSALSSAKALKLCPKLMLVRGSFEKYRHESHIIREIFYQFTDLVEPVSVDEAYLDVSDCKLFQSSATLIAGEIRKLIFEKTKLTASAGIAPNKFLAKIASDWNKPNGMLTVAPKNIAAFVRQLKVAKIPGVGIVTAKKMATLGIFTCTDLQQKTKAELYDKFGVWGTRLYELCRGIDDNPVVTSRIRKSLSVENTFSSDLQNPDECLDKVPRLFEEFWQRFNKIKKNYFIKGMFVKVKFYDFTVTTLENSSFKNPSVKNFKELLKCALKRQDKKVRLLGLGVRLATSEPNIPKNIQLELPFVFIK